MEYIDFFSELHTRTKRDYVARVNEFPKSKAIEIAKRYDKDYWDGDRKFGFGGYGYDGRWNPVAAKMAEHYRLKPGEKVLDVGCGKAFLLYGFTQTVPGIEIKGLDISKYAIENAKEEVKPYLEVGDAKKLPYEGNSFDFVVSLNTIHNLYIYDLFSAIKEIERVGRKNKYIVVESYRNEEEKVNMMYWVLTGECFFSVKEWEWIFKQCGYTGDYSFIYFE